MMQINFNSSWNWMQKEPAQATLPLIGYGASKL
jgi:hypothetical protein